MSPIIKDHQTNATESHFATSHGREDLCQSTAGYANNQIRGERCEGIAGKPRCCCHSVWCPVLASTSKPSTEWQPNHQTLKKRLLSPRHQSEGPGRRHWCSREGLWKPRARQCCYWSASRSMMTSPCFLWNYQTPAHAGRRERNISCLKANPIKVHLRQEYLFSSSTDKCISLRTIAGPLLRSSLKRLPCCKVKRSNPGVEIIGSLRFRRQR